MNRAPVYVYLIPNHRKELISDIRNKMTKSATGKPYLRNCMGEHISISHSGKYFAVAMGTCNLGMDLQEHIKDQRDYERIMKRFFHETEINFIMEGREEEFLARFFRIWTAKESYVKYTGKGIDDNFSRFSVLALEKELTFSYANEIEEGYTLCVCMEEPQQIILKYLD